MKKFRTILILLIVLAALLLVYFVASPMWSDEGGETSDTEPTHTVAVIDHNKLVGFELTVIRENDGEKVTDELSFSLNEGASAWLWSEDGEIPLDNTVFATVVTALTESSSKYKLDNVGTEQLAEFGLDAPAYKLALTFDDGSSKEYGIGALNSFNSLYYFSEASAPNTVYMVGKEVVSALDLEIFDFVLEETPPEITEGKIVGAAYYGGDGMLREFKFHPSGNADDYTDKYNWYYSYQSMAMSSIPPMFSMNGALADTLTDLITGMGFEECVSFDPADEKFGFSESRKLTVKYNVASEANKDVLTEKTYVIYIGKQTEDGDIYAHTEGSKLVYLLDDADEWVKIINAEHKDLMSTEIWLPNYELIESMTLKTGDKSLTVNLKNTEGKITYSSESELDTEKFEAFLKALDALRATSNTEALEENKSLEKKTYFALDIKFNSGKTLQLTVETYTENYCIADFPGSALGKLITAEEAEKLEKSVSELFAESTGA